MELKKNKKSMDLSIWNIILGFVVVAAVAAILFFGVFKPSISKSLRPLTAINYEILNNKCKVEGRDLFDPANQKNLEPLEKESDGFPDNCDICLGGDNRVTISGIPKDCYTEPTKEINSYEKMCYGHNGCFVKEKDQCCILPNKDCPENCETA